MSILIEEAMEEKTLTRPSSANPKTLATEKDLIETRLAHYHAKGLHKENGLAIIWNAIPENQPLSEHLRTHAVYYVPYNKDEAIRILETIAENLSLQLRKSILQPLGMQFYTYHRFQEPTAFMLINRMKVEN